jgi:O-antigen ligase
MSALSIVQGRRLAAARRIPISRPVVWMTTLVAFAFTPIFGGGETLSEAATPSRIIELALIGSVLCIGAYKSSHIDLRRLPQRALQPFLCAVVFALWAMFTGIFSELIVTAIGKACELLAVVLSAYLAVVVALSDPRADETIVTNSLAVGLGLAIVLLLGCNVLLHGTPFPYMQNDLNDPFESFGRARFYLGNSHPLTTGTLLSLAIVLIANSSYPGVYRLIAMVPLAILLQEAGARASTGGCILAVIVTGYLQFRNPSTRSFVGSISAAVLISVNVVFFIFGSWTLLATSVIGADIYTFDGRTDLWSFAIGKALETPVLGVGYFNTRLVLLPVFSFAGQTHNSLIEVFLGTGIFGLMIALLFVAQCIRAALVTKSRLLVGLLIALMIESMLNPELFTPSLPMFLLTVGVIDACALRRGRRRSIGP